VVMLNLGTTRSPHMHSWRGLDCSVCNTLHPLATYGLMNTKVKKITSSYIAEHQDLVALSLLLVMRDF
jgi:hypothetical protein